VTAYIIVNLEVHDQALFAQYREAMPDLLRARGGSFVARGGELRVLEGPDVLPRLVILGFPEMAAAQAFYDSDEYAPLKAKRHAAARSHVLLVEGCQPDQFALSNVRSSPA